MSQPFSDIRFRLHNLHEDFSEMQEEIQNETENCLTESEPKVKNPSKIWISAFTIENKYNFYHWSKLLSSSPAKIIMHFES